MTQHDLAIEYRAPAQLKAFARTARTHSRKQIRQIADSIERFGFTNPILLDDEGTILAGHGRVVAAQLLKLDRVPCVRLSSMSDVERRAYVLADNKLALNAGWDEEILAGELKGLLEAVPSFDIAVTGFSIAEVDMLIEDVTPAPPDPADDRLPTLRSRDRTTSRAGDLWLLGPHRVLYGDCTDAASFSMLMGDDKAQMVFTDPPYNVPIAGHVSGLGKARHREFAMASGEMSRVQFVSFLQSVFQHLVDWSRDGSIHFVCMDWRHLTEIMTAGSLVYTELKNLCVWAKDNGGMGSFYRSRHELVFAFKNGTGPHINSFELGQHGRHRTNVWEYRGMNSRGRERQADLALHPTVKPVALIADAIRDVSERGGIVLDCFGGSGSTLIAAHKIGRRARLVEIDPVYVDRMIRRWQTYAKDDAVLAGTGQSFDEVAVLRAQPAGQTP